MVYIFGSIFAASYLTLLVFARNAKQEMEVFRKARGWRELNEF